MIRCEYLQILFIENFSFAGGGSGSTKSNIHRPTNPPDMTTHVPHVASDSDSKDHHHPFLPLISSPLNPHSHTNPQNPLHQASLDQQPPSDILRRQILDSLVSPSDILQYKRLDKRTRGNPITNQDADMDKRHPSSFQQLEKVR